MAMRITTQMLTRSVLSDVTAASQRLAKTQQQLSSGKLLTKPSDDPQAVARALMLRKEMEGAQQHQRNVSEGQGWAEVTDSALGNIADALLRVRELTVHGASDTTPPDARQSVAEELKGLVDTIKSSANASYGGRYVFGGTRTDVPPYALGASDAYGGDTGALVREIGPGVTVTINVLGSDAIGNGPTGMLASIRNVITALEADDGAAVRAGIPALDTALEGLSTVRATVGATANRLDAAAGRLAEYEGTTLKLLSETEDVDIAEAMINFSVQKSALEAGLKAGANIVQTSLLDFLR